MFRLYIELFGGKKGIIHRNQWQEQKGTISQARFGTLPTDAIRESFYFDKRVAGRELSITHLICRIFRGLKFESDPRGIGYAFHRAGAEIGSPTWRVSDSESKRGRFQTGSGVLAVVRKSIQVGESYQLREPAIPYRAHSGAKKCDIGPENTYFWDVILCSQQVGSGQPVAMTDHLITDQLTNKIY